MIVVKVGGSLFDSAALGPALRAFIESLGPAEVLLVPGGGPVADAVRKLDRTHGLGEEAAHWLALQSLSVTRTFLERLVGSREEPNPLTPFPKKEGGTEPNTTDITQSATVLSPSPLRGGVGEGLFSEPPPPAPLASGEGEPPAGSPCNPLLLGKGEQVLGASGRTASVNERVVPPPFPLARGAGKVGCLDCFTFALEDEGCPGALPHSWSVTTDSIAARAALVLRAERLVLLKSVDVPPGTPWEFASANGWVDTHFPQIAKALACPIEVVNFRSRLHARA
ncbi:hypothetical protein J8F10_29900 [Gemmata sp. G18]|uniref:Aspartate/glutamate/uridylate kinase domain-containing protein n=1 Tax=Gemmata palustris TaxID=2822762 RepID=A0ABS5C0K1_9BACT|nr:hypothetical protein [Gemmata palustris]MBP3959479.1 hypothetical protein [Gemmata palustris]